MASQGIPEMYHFNFTEQELAIIAEALGNMPFKSVVALVAKIQSQIKPQAEEPKLDKKPTK